MKKRRETKVGNVTFRKKMKSTKGQLPFDDRYCCTSCGDFSRIPQILENCPDFLTFAVSKIVKF
jgi:hypothetical protein